MHGRLLVWYKPQLRRTLLGLRIAACHFPARSSKVPASRSASWNSRRTSAARYPGAVAHTGDVGVEIAPEVADDPALARRLDDLLHHVCHLARALTGAE
jgi:hypothetical protein